MPVKVRPYKNGKQPGVWEIHIRGYFPDQTLYEEKKRSELARAKAQLWGQQREHIILTMGPRGWREHKEEKAHPPKTLEEYAPGWLAADCAANKRALSTKLHRFSVLENQILPRFGKSYPGDLGELDFQRLKSDMSDYSAHHVNSAIGLLRSILRGAVKDGQRKEAVPRVPFLPRPQTESLWFEPEEYEQLFSKTTDATMRVVILLGGDAGLRMGEMLALEWGALYFGRNQLHVKQAFSRGEIRAPKWDSYRTIELTERLREALQALPTKSGKVVRQVGMLRRLTKRGEGGPLGVRKLALTLALAEESAGLIPRGRLHMLRHTFGARLAMAGATVKEIAELMGHKSLKTTEIYMHLSPSLKGRAIRLLEKSGDGVETIKETKAKGLNLL